MLPPHRTAGFLALLAMGAALGCTPNAPCSYAIAREALAPSGLAAEPAYAEYVVVQGFGHKRRTTRWRADLPVVRLFLATPELEEPELAGRAVEAARQGIETWTGTLPSGGPRFEFVADAEQADFELRWEELAGDGTRFGLGEASYYRDTHDALEWRPDRIVRIDPRWVRAENGLEAVRDAAAHEMGHLLGLSGHSDDPEDLMYAIWNRGQRGPSERDRNTLRVVYACPRFAVWEGPRPPPELDWGAIREAFDRYRLAPTHKAFAVLIDSRQRLATAGFASGQPSHEEAEREALRQCEAHRGTLRGECRIFARDDSLAAAP